MTRETERVAAVFAVRRKALRAKVIRPSRCRTIGGFIKITARVLEQFARSKSVGSLFRLEAKTKTREPNCIQFRTATSIFSSSVIIGR